MKKDTDKTLSRLRTAQKILSGVVTLDSEDHGRQQVALDMVEKWIKKLAKKAG